jgi:DNA-binding transcriptional ArsR family regulator
LAEGDVLISDPRALRALAHPARLAMLEYLYDHGSATATAAAAAAGVSAAAGSYHMRLLERYGLVEDAGGGSGRERPWRARGFSFEARPEAGEAERAAAGALLAHLIERGNRWEQDFLLHNRTLPAEWSDAAHIANKRLSLSPRQATELGERIDALCDEYRRAPEAAGAENVAVLVRVIPHRVRPR